MNYIYICVCVTKLWTLDWLFLFRTTAVKGLSFETQGCHADVPGLHPKLETFCLFQTAPHKE